MHQEARNIIQAASDAGMFLSENRDMQAIGRIRRDARAWLREAQASLETMTPGEALETIHLYDLLHRIAYSIPADTTLETRCTLRALDALIHGDQTVNPETLTRQILIGLKRRDPAYQGRPLRWLQLHHSKA